MFIALWRHNQNCPWCFVGTFNSYDEARKQVDKYGRYDMVKRQYTIVQASDLELEII